MCLKGEHTFRGQIRRYHLRINVLRYHHLAIELVRVRTASWRLLDAFRGHLQRAFLGRDGYMSSGSKPRTSKHNRNIFEPSGMSMNVVFAWLTSYAGFPRVTGRSDVNSGTWWWRRKGYHPLLIYRESMIMWQSPLSITATTINSLQNLRSFLANCLWMCK